MRLIITLIAISVFAISCSQDTGQSIEDYLVENGLEAQKHDSGLYYIIEKEGVGSHPTISNKVKMHYKGYYLDGVKFDSSYDRGEALNYQLAGLIEGWQIGVPLFKKGGKGILFIPPDLGYGSHPTNGIRDNAVLVFEIELIDFE